MRTQGTDAGSLRASLNGKTVYLIPYCHSDIAWTHSRAWHVNRYTLALDEALDLLDSNPTFCYFVDTWTEMLRPYLAHRPGNRRRLARHLASGRLALCGGHWGNLRMTQVGNETIVRHLVLGPERVRRCFPGFRPRVYANMDVCLGHSQAPQLLRLAGIEGYMAWRPSSALDAQGVPRSFLWEGLSGDSIPVARLCYCGLNNVPAGAWGEDWDESFRCLGPDLKIAAAQKGVSALAVFVGMDDTRPLRTCGDDLPCRTDELIAAWHAAGSGRMRYGTPEHLMRHLRRDKLPTVRGVLDEAEVCYNLNWAGHEGLAWWREKGDRALVEAEMLDALAAVRGHRSDQKRLRAAWEDLLDATPHAQQMLFAEDEFESRQGAVGAVRTAARVRDAALARLLPVSLPLDATHIAFVGLLGGGGPRVARTLIPNHDRTHGSFVLLDEDGAELPMQVTDVFVGQDEFEIECLADIPPCGVRAYRIEWRKSSVTLPPPQDLPLDCEVAHGHWSLQFKAGHFGRHPRRCVRTDVACGGGALVRAAHGAVLRRPEHVAPGFAQRGAGASRCALPAP